MTNPMGAMDWPNLFLYNGFLMEADGECLHGQPKQFYTIAEAEAWLESADIRGSVQFGKRRGDLLVPAEAMHYERPTNEELERSCR